MAKTYAKRADYLREYRSRPEVKERERARKREQRARNPETHRTRKARWASTVKAEAIGAYGGACACCGETELAFLTLGHVAGDGAAHRAETGGAGLRTYAWLRRRGYPTGIVEVQCFNCNTGAHINGGVCPHKEHR